MTVTPMRGGREAWIFVLLTPVLVLMSIRLEQIDPRVPGKFSFLVLLVPTLLVALVGKRWHGLLTALICGLGCILAGWIGSGGAEYGLTRIGFPLLLGTALLATGTLLTLRSDEVQHRVAELQGWVRQVVAAQHAQQLAQVILEAATRIVACRCCRLYVWDGSRQEFVELLTARPDADGAAKGTWRPGQGTEAGTAQAAGSAAASSTAGTGSDFDPPRAPLLLIDGSETWAAGSAPNLRDWQAACRQLGPLQPDELRLPLTSGDGDVHGFLRFRLLRPPGEDAEHFLNILANSAGLALRNVQLYERLRQQARRDGLTGALNYSAFQEELQRAVGRAEADGRSLALVIVDLDNLKAVNDRYGHQVGSLMIQKFADAWRRLLPPGSVLARYGGDEFTCILQDVSEADVLGHLEELRRRTAEDGIEIGGQRVTVGFSMGLAWFPQQARTPDQLFRLADEAMYQAKRAGKGDTHVRNSHTTPAPAMAGSTP